MRKLRENILALRIDDVCPRMDAEKFDRMVREIEARGVTGLLGIVPDCRDPDLNTAPEDPAFWDKMKELQRRGWVLGMHGYTHVYDSQGKNLAARRRDSEFAGHPYEVQRERLRLGRAALAAHGIEADVFFAPAHTYDRTTLRALRDTGFRYVSDGRARDCYRYRGLTMIPCEPGMARRVRGVMTLALHPCANTGADFTRVLSTLDRNSAYLTDYRAVMDRPVRFSAARVLEERGRVFFERHIRPWLFPALVRVRDRVRTALHGEKGAKQT